MNQNLATLIHELRTGSRSLLDYIEDVATHFEQREPDVLAFVPEVGRFQRLRREAQALLDQFPDPETRPALFGLLIGVKDIFHVDGFVTRAGSQLPVENLQGPEAPSVTALRRHGALIMGKTVTTEFAYFGPGPTRNPHNPAHTPGGSSSGSAAAVGAGLCPLAFGTQTIGSINRPAAFCGAVGYKPSYDRVDKSNVLPLSGSYDHVGLISTSVHGLAEVARFLCADWRGDLVTTIDTLPRLGIPIGPYLDRADDAGHAHFEQVVGSLRAAGFDVISVEAMTDFNDIYERHQLLMSAETAAIHADWYKQYRDLYHPKTVELIERGQTHDAESVAAAAMARFTLRDELTALMDQHQLDLWISPPACGPAPAGLDSTGDPVMNLPWTQAGLPTVNIPTGRIDHLPMGLQLTGHWYGDESLLAHAQSIRGSLTSYQTSS